MGNHPIIFQGESVLLFWHAYLVDINGYRTRDSALLFDSHAWSETAWLETAVEQEFPILQLTQFNPVNHMQMLFVDIQLDLYIVLNQRRSFSMID
jgi:hypothetical protein